MMAHNMRRLLLSPQRVRIVSNSWKILCRSKSSTSTTSSSLYSDEFWQSPNVIDVTSLAESLRDTVRQYTRRHRLCLVGILAEMGPYRQDAELYSERIYESCKADGIDYEVWRCHSSQDIQNRIQDANDSPDIHGILIFYPIFPTGPKGPYKNRLAGVYYKTDDDYFRDLVIPGKDVEGLCGTKWFHHSPNTTRTSTTSTTHGDNHSTQQQQPHRTLNTPNAVYPCTAVSVQRILDHYHSQGSWENQVVSIVNRSEIVGRPLAAMLGKLGATVYSIDINSILRFQPNGRLHRCMSTRTLEDCLAESTIVVTGVPQAEFQIPTDKLQEGTTLVNVSEFTNVCEHQIVARQDIHYIPQVGKVTVAMLEQNLMKLHELNNMMMTTTTMNQEEPESKLSSSS